MKATLKSGVEVILEDIDVTISERTNPRSGLKGWNGYFRIPRGQHIAPDAYSLELADGRRGEIIVNRVKDFYDAFFVGNGDLIAPEK